MRRITSALAVAGMIAVGLTGTAAQAHDYGWGGYGGYGWHQRAWQEHAWREQAWREHERHERHMRTAAIIGSVVQPLIWSMSHR